jgi:hypothetical protein
VLFDHGELSPRFMDRILFSELEEHVRPIMPGLSTL